MDYRVSRGDADKLLGDLTGISYGGDHTKKTNFTQTFGRYANAAKMCFQTQFLGAPESFLSFT